MKCLWWCSDRHILKYAALLMYIIQEINVEEKYLKERVKKKVYKEIKKKRRKEGNGKKEGNGEGRGGVDTTIITFLRIHWIEVFVASDLMLAWWQSRLVYTLYGFCIKIAFAFTLNCGKKRFISLAFFIRDLNYKVICVFFRKFINETMDFYYYRKSFRLRRECSKCSHDGKAVLLTQFTVLLLNSFLCLV